MFGMGWGEIFVIAIVALVVIGPDKLPEVARALAKVVRQGRRLMHEVKESIDMEAADVHTSPAPTQHPHAQVHYDNPMDDLPGVNEPPAPHGVDPELGLDSQSAPQEAQAEAKSEPSPSSSPKDPSTS
ncbi:MAG: twin-arginine translocase subunit TatB [Magnetococcales bacterium]|nr:twin-arginine translocase subunit TatB [Magnetococcales bacterium]